MKRAVTKSIKITGRCFLKIDRGIEPGHEGREGKGEVRRQHVQSNELRTVLLELLETEDGGGHSCG